MKEWYSVAEILKLKDTTLPEMRSTLQRYITERNWDLDKNRSREVKGKGGLRKEYHYTLFVSVKGIPSNVTNNG